MSFSTAVLLLSAYMEDVEDKNQFEFLILNIQRKTLRSPKAFSTPVPCKAKQQLSRVQPNRTQKSHKNTRAYQNPTT